MKKVEKSVIPDALPLHLYLHSRMKQLIDLTNVDVAEALGYPRPNVIAMIFKGHMKLPLDKVSDMARILEIDPAALLRRVLAEYEPGVLKIIEDTLGRSCTLSANEEALVDFTRVTLGHEDVPIVVRAPVAAQLQEILLARQRGHHAELLAVRRK